MPPVLDLPVSLSEVTRLQLRAELRENRSKAYCEWLQDLALAGFPDAASRQYLARRPMAWGANEVQRSLDSLECKSATAPGSVSDPAWAGPLVGITSLASGFAAVVHSKSVFGQIRGLNQIPFRTRVPVQSQDPTFGWIGENIVKGVSAAAFTSGVVLEMLKAVGLIVLTNEFLQLTTAGVADALRNMLVRTLVAFQDKAFLDPASAALTGVRPASITNGVTPIAGTGNFANDMQALLDQFFAARPGATDPTLLANGAIAAQLRAPNSGFAGYDIIATEAALNNVIMVDGSGIYYADGGVVIDISKEATVQMNSVPDSPPTASTTLTSLWQQNLVGYRAERTLNWTATPTAVAYLAGR
jgi:hypothetical protein